MTKLNQKTIIKIGETIRKPLSLYIHIPFCNSKCAYCNFVSGVGNLSQKARYTANLIEEIRMRAKEFNPRYEIVTIYIGGGTPSCMPPKTISSILNEIYSKFTVRNQAEITLEVNPESVTHEKVIEYVRAGVNRISMGLQCIEPSILALMNRKHTLQDFENAVAEFRNAGINNISADIILGYPNQTLSYVNATVNKLIQMDIPHISAYMLQVEEGTVLAASVENKKLVVPSEKETIMMYQNVVKLLRNAGYTRYEVSNFAKTGFRSKHNQVYWDRGEYLGLGLSSHSFVDGIRFANFENMQKYVERIENLKLPVESIDRVSQADAKEEYIMLKLRMESGIDLDDYKKQFNEDFIEKNKEKIAELIKLNLLKIEENHIKATDSGFLVLNRIILELV